jgi:Fusaric acid resistance protein-like
MPQPWWKPSWSVPAAMRAVRATVIVPSLFAVTYKVIGDPQMALFATFGGFATLTIASFGGTRSDKLASHLCLAIVGSLALIVGTLVSGTTWLAAIVTVPVTFAIFFGGVLGPNAASGSTAALFAYVLPVASAGNASMIGSRLAGWWLASAAGTIAVLVFSPAAGSRLPTAAAELAAELGARLRAAALGETTNPEAMRAAKEKLRAAFTAAPYRPTGLATADQALASLVQLLEWGATQVGDAFDGHIDLTNGCKADLELLRIAAELFADTHALLTGQAADPDFVALEAARAKSAEHLRELSGGDGEPDARVAAAQAVHAQAIAVVARSVAADALIVGRRASEETIAAERRDWYGAPAEPAAAKAAESAAASAVPTTWSARGAALTGSPRMAGLVGAATLVRRHATVRSVWFLNALRGSVALAAAVAIADLSGVQHGFWVVLGTLSVLRTSAAATGATAWRGLAGTVVGFVVGAALLTAIGTGQDALWAALPVAILVAAYAPGTTPFLVGQAAFTVTIVVLFNLLAPIGWTVGLLRIEDVAIGCGVSFAVGALFWPRGVSAVVADDLADSFRSGAVYLTQAVDWALSELMVPPAAAVAANGAGLRLDDAVRGFLTDQGSKRLSKEDLWTLVNASTRLRLTAHTLAGLRTTAPAPGSGPGGACLPLTGSEEYAGAPACVMLQSTVADLAGFYGAVADEVSRPGSRELTPVSPPAVTGPAVPRREANRDASTRDVSTRDVTSPAAQLPHPHLLWVQEHLHHLSTSAQTVAEPALHMAEIRQRPWWR